MSPRSCIILVPFAKYITPECEMSLKELERRGYSVNRVRGYAAIDQARNQMATDALAAGFAETFWIDSDVDFHPNAVEQIRAHQFPITAGIVARKGVRALASQTLPGTIDFGVGKGKSPCEILYAGAGFLHVRREVYEKIHQQFALPVCNERFGRPMIPFFQPMIHTTDKGPWYLSEDYAFCERARQSGFKIMADPSIRLWHIGEYHYGWEDAGLERPRYDSFLFKITDSPNDL